MSETVLKFLLSELATIRIVCKKPGCGKIVEMPLADLVPANQARVFLTCPFCGTGYDPTGQGVSRLHLLAVGLARVQELADQKLVDVEFVLPAEKPQRP